MLQLCFVAGFVSATIWVLRDLGFVCVYVKFCEADLREEYFHRASQPAIRLQRRKTVGFFGLVRWRWSGQLWVQ